MAGDPYFPPARRPLAARSWGISRSLASWFVRRGIAPNTISITGMIAAMSAGAMFVATAWWVEGQPWLWLASGLLISIRGAANMLDGMVALESNRASPIGELFNEVPDRISDCALLIGLGFAAGSEPILGAFAALASVFTAYIRAIGKVAGAPQDYRGPMAKTHRMGVVLIVCALGLFAPVWVATPIDGIGVTPVSVALLSIVVGCLITSVRRLLGAGNYLRGHRP